MPIIAQSSQRRSTVALATVTTISAARSKLWAAMMKVRFSVALLVHPPCINASMQGRVTRRFSADMRRVKKRSLEGLLVVPLAFEAS